MAQRAAYYNAPAPAGSSSPFWFDAFVDNPSLPSNECDTKKVVATNTALCFDAACAPPKVAGFDCWVL